MCQVACLASCLGPEVSISNSSMHLGKQALCHLNRDVLTTVRFDNLVLANPNRVHQPKPTLRPYSLSASLPLAPTAHVYWNDYIGTLVCELVGISGLKYRSGFASYFQFTI